VKSADTTAPRLALLSPLRARNYLLLWAGSAVAVVGEAMRVAAMGKTFVKMRKDAAGVARAVRVPEHVDAVADMACGAQAHFQVSSTG